jgi:hypothetical protein
MCDSQGYKTKSFLSHSQSFLITALTTEPWPKETKIFLQGSALKMEAVFSSLKLVSTCQSTQHYNPEDPTMVSLVSLIKG